MRARILVIDDDKAFSSNVKRALRHENLDIVCADSPAQALAIYSSSKMDFDLMWKTTFWPECSREKGHPPLLCAFFETRRRHHL